MNPLLPLLRAAREHGKDASPEEKAAVETAVRMSRREKIRAFREPSVEERKRTSVLLPSARELFRIRPRLLQEDGTRRTVAWPTFDTPAERDAYVHGRLLDAGMR